MYLRQLPVGQMKNFAYLLGPAGSPETAVVDPAWEADALLGALAADGRTLSSVILTHAHGDHWNALPALLSEADVPVYVHALEAAASPELRRAAGEALRTVSGGERVAVGPVSLELLHTPGHTPGGLCVHSPAGLVTGDTLFIGACGRCDLGGGDARALYRSLTSVIGALPGGTVVWPGHDYGRTPSSTLARERQESPVFSHGSEEDFVAWRMRPRA